MRKVLVTVTMAVCMFFGNAQAEDFSLALSKAVTNIPPGADVMGMGNCWTATPLFSSHNPAVFSIDNEETVGISGTYGLISFKNGPEINIYSATATTALPVGNLQLSYSDARSGKSPTLMDAEMKVASVPTIDLQYGVKAGSDVFAEGDELHLGVGYAYGESELRFFSLTDIEDVGTFQTKSTSFSKSHSASVGAVYRPNKKINLGVFFGKFWSDDEEELAIADLDFQESFSGKSQSDQFRAGFGWQILDATFIAVDYQHLDFDSEGSDQWFAGIEQGIVKDVLYAYGGIADKSPTLGLGLYLENGGINVGYIHDFAKSLEPYLGKSKAMMATVYYEF